MRSGCITLASILLTEISVGALHANELSRYARSSATDAVIIVSPDKRASFKIPRTIYGTFLEHIRQSVYGGVSAELLENPSLEAHPASLDYVSRRFGANEYRQSARLNLPMAWLPLSPAGRRYELRSGSAANSSDYLYVMGMPGREIGIRQPVYLPVERQLEYHGLLFALADAGPIALNVSFRQHDNADRILSQSNLDISELHRWVKLPFKLILPKGAVPALENVDFAISLKNGGRISLDEIRLYPADAIDGLDPEVIRYSEQLASPLVRYGGNFSSGYHWEDGVGLLDARPTKINQAWGIPEYNEFGTDELMAFCRRIGSLPQICLNLGSGSVDEARNWVEYCQGSADSPQGRRRAANGHPEPYKVSAWEFGNELYDRTQLGWYTPEGYASRYLEFFHAIAPLVPVGTKLLATGAELNAFEKWNAVLLKIPGPEIQYITTHLVADLEQTADRGKDYEGVAAAGLALPVGVGRRLGALRTQIRATSDRKQVAYSEWLFRSPEGSRLPNFDNMGGAVIAAAWLNMLALNSNWIPVANMTGLMEFAGIHKRRGRTYVTPQYWVLHLYSKYAGDTVIGTETRVGQYDVHGGQLFAPEIPNVPFLDVLGTAKSDQLSLFVVNRNPHNAQSASIRLDHAAGRRDVEVLTLAGALLDRNDEEHPATVRPVASHTQARGGELHHVFPPCSVTVFLFAPPTQVELSGVTQATGVARRDRSESAHDRKEGATARGGT